MRRGLNPSYADFSVEEIPLSEIGEPYRYGHPRRIYRYLEMLKQGKEAPPIELISNRAGWSFLPSSMRLGRRSESPRPKQTR
jgi:hypothetical protein